MFEMNLLMLRPHLEVFIDLYGLPDQYKIEKWHKTDCFEYGEVSRPMRTFNLFFSSYPGNIFTSRDIVYCNTSEFRSLNHREVKQL